MAPRREVGFSWHPTVSRGLSVARSLALPQIRGCSPLMTRVPWRRRGVPRCGVCWYAIMLVIG